MAETEVQFVMAFPGWEVLYYFKGGRYDSAPVVAWGIHAIDGVFARAVPITSDLAWDIHDDRTICTPDGDVTHSEHEHWPTLATWLDDMQRRETENPDKLPTARPSPQLVEGNTLVLDNFRRKFQMPHGEGS